MLPITRNNILRVIELNEVRRWCQANPDKVLGSDDIMPLDGYLTHRFNDNGDLVVVYSPNQAGHHDIEWYNSKISRSLGRDPDLVIHVPGPIGELFTELENWQGYANHDYEYCEHNATAQDLLDLITRSSKS